jgi:hypothetical protein
MKIPTFVLGGDAWHPAAVVQCGFEALVSSRIGCVWAPGMNWQFTEL